MVLDKFKKTKHCKSYVIINSHVKGTKMDFLNVKLVTEEPTNYEPTTLYFIKSDKNQQMNIHMTGKDTTSLRTFQEEDFEKMIESIDEDLQNIKIIDSFSTIFGTKNNKTSIYYNKNSHVSNLDNFEEMGKTKSEKYRMLDITARFRVPYGRKIDIASTYTGNDETGTHRFIAIYKEEDAIVYETMQSTDTSDSFEKDKTIMAPLVDHNLISSDDKRALVKLVVFPLSTSTVLNYGLVGCVNTTDNKYSFHVIRQPTSPVANSYIKSNIDFDDLEEIYEDKIFPYVPKTTEIANTIKHGAQVSKYVFVVPAKLKSGVKGHFVIKNTEAIFIENTEEYNTVASYKFGTQLQFSYNKTLGDLLIVNSDTYSTTTPEANANNLISVGRVYLFNGERPDFLGVGSVTINQPYPLIPLLFKRPNGEIIIIVYNALTKTSHRVEMDSRMSPVVKQFAVAVKGSQDGIMVISDTTNGHGCYVAHFWKNGLWSNYFYRLNDYHSFNYPDLFYLLSQSYYDGLLPINARNMWYKEHTPARTVRVLRNRVID